MVSEYGAALPPNAASIPRVSVGGVLFDPLTEAQVVEHVRAAVRSGHGGTVLTPNVDILRQLQDRDLRGALQDADLVLADGFPVVLASRLRGTPVPERVTGSSLIHSLSDALLTDGGRVLVVGGVTEDVGRAAAFELEQQTPGATPGSVSHHYPPFGFERDPVAMERLHQAVRDTDPSIVFLGLGFPKQDLLARRMHETHPRTWFVGCGGAIAMVAQEVSRAPRWVQRSGVEWIYRLAQEPRRLARRYLVHDLPYAARLLLRSMAFRVSSRWARA